MRCCALLALLLPMAARIASGMEPSELTVSPQGPLKTLADARDAVRKLRRARPGGGPIVVTIHGGTYFLDEPLRLGPGDSGSAAAPVIYQAAAGESVTLSGGRRIGGWRRRDGGLWVADVPAAKGPDGWRFRQLFVGGRRQIRARTPNHDPNRPYAGGWAFVQPAGDPAKGRFGDCLARIHARGDTFTWAVDVPADGEYAFWMRYGALNRPFGNASMDGRTAISIDAGPAVALKNLPDTGAWGTFAWKKAASLRLTKGLHTLRWTNRLGGGLNWDAFALSDDGAWKPRGTKLAPPASGRHVVVVQVETYASAKAKEFVVTKGSSGRNAPTDRFHFAPGDLGRWPRSPEPEVHVLPAWGWVNAILSVARIDHERRICHVTNRNCTQALRPGNRYFVENVFEALDAPGEWFLDGRAGRLYYRPAESDFDGRDVVAPALDRLVELAGDPNDGGRWVEHVVFRGLTFRHTTYSLEAPSVYTPSDAAVHLRKARRCVIERCRFEGVGGYAVKLSDRASENFVLANTVWEAGQGGVLMTGDTKTQPRGNVVAGNEIRRCGRIWKHVAGVYVTTGSGNRVAHNTVADVPRYGISLKSFSAGSASHDNVVEYNRLLRTNLETNDTGAIETLGRDRKDSGNVIRCNLILDSVGLKTTETGEILRPYYSWGVYLDDYSSGTVVAGNIVARTFRGGIHVHLGRNNVIEDNIFVDGHDQQVEFNGRADMTDNVFRRNIVACRTGRLIRVSRWTEKVFAECDRNCYGPMPVSLAEAADATPRGPWAQWRSAGWDRHSVLADPRFRRPAKDDYRLLADSPALKLGHRPTDVSKIGPAGYRRPAGVP